MAEAADSRYRNDGIIVNLSDLRLDTVKCNGF